MFISRTVDTQYLSSRVYTSATPDRCEICDCETVSSKTKDLWYNRSRCSLKSKAFNPRGLCNWTVCTDVPLSNIFLSFYLSQWGPPAPPHCVPPRRSLPLRCRAVWVARPPAARRLGPGWAPDREGGNAPAGRDAKARSPWIRAWWGTVRHPWCRAAAVLIGCEDKCRTWGLRKTDAKH